MIDAPHNIPELDCKGLRQFGLMTGGMFAGLFGLFFPWLLDHSWPLWPWVIFGVLALWALTVPSTLRPVYRLWMRLALVLNRVTTPIILGAVYFLVFAPIACAMRIFGRDPMARRFDENTMSYRVPSQRVPTKNMEKPF